MANQEQLAILKQGVEVWNNWRDRNPSTKINLKGADLRRIDLIDVNLREADLRRVKLWGAEHGETNEFTGMLLVTKFSGANLNGADLRGVNLTAVNLSGADLSRANLIGANLNYADLNGAKFTNVQLGTTVFGYTDLSKALHIEKAEHTSASSIGMDTIYYSNGKIPEIFLRGCGLSDLQIEFVKLANPGLDPEQVTDITYKIHQLYLGGGIQYFSCFISYNSKDEEFAKYLHNDLQNNGVRCWFAPEDMKIGDKIRSRIDQEIRLRDKLLVILSKNSVNSEWVGDEVEAALEEERKGSRLVLFPIRLDDTVMNTRDDWAAKIKRRRHIGDFSNWKDKGSYHKEFERLLRDLKATGT